MKNVLRVAIASAVCLIAPTLANAAEVSAKGHAVRVYSGDSSRIVRGSNNTVYAGDRIVVGPNSSAIISYGGGCNFSIQAGRTIRVPAESPCAAAANGTTNPTNLDMIAGIGGTAVVFGVIAKKASESNSASP